jgi:peptidoglycan/LPS O-acetylase OafA/YrhL
VVILTLRKRKDLQAMSVDSTTELKGLAILAIVLTHVGYSLASDYHFLQPLSNWSGVAVDLFLFLSAFGLTLSALKKDLTIVQFYRRRLSKVIIPVWVSLTVFLFLDKVFLQLTYPTSLMWQNFLGWFPEADILHNVNSPLWFITPLLFYYLFFPIIFVKRIPEITAIIFYLIGSYFLQFNLPIAPRVAELWSLHYLAFPLGIVVASIFTRFRISAPYTVLSEKFSKVKNIEILRYLILMIFMVAWVYVFLHLDGGTPQQKQLLSLVSLLLTVFIFMLKQVESKFLLWLGVFSFEIYLLHWPLMYRYDFLFKWLPAGLAVFIYLIIFILVGWGIKNFRFILDKGKKLF